MRFARNDSGSAFMRRRSLTTAVGLVLAAFLAVVVAKLTRAAASARRDRRVDNIPTGRFRRSAKLATMSVRSARSHAAARARGAFASEERKRWLREEAHLKSSTEIVETLGNMKGMLMKIAQIMSFAADGLPEELKTQLETLQSQAPPMDYSLVAGVMREELGGDPEVIFRSFETEPTAAASIGQVHRAQLPDGTPVAVKVQYPDVEKAIRADLDNTAALNAVVKLLSPGRDVSSMMEELRARLSEELNYEIEAANQQTFIDIYEGHPYVVIPRVFHEYSSRRVLTMDWIDGYTLAEAIEEPADVRREIAEKIFRFVYESINFGVFNADPHPGNYLFLEDGRVAFLDFGCTKHFSEGEYAMLDRFNHLVREGDPSEFARMLDQDGWLVDGALDKVDAQQLYDYYHVHWEPYLRDEETLITQEWVNRVNRAAADPAGPVRYLQAAPGLFFMLRLGIGVNVIMAKLGARMNFYRLGLELDGGPPSTPLGEETATWRARRGFSREQGELMSSTGL